MNTVLKRINRINGVKGCLVVNKEGMVVTAEVAEGVDESGISALTSSIVVTIEKALERLSFGRLTRFSISGDRGRIIIMALHRNLVLTVVTKKDVNMGLLKVEIEKAAEDIGEIVKR